MTKKKEGLVVDDRAPNNKIYHCRTLSDVGGHTFCCKDIKDLSILLNHFIADKEKIIRIKNNFANPSAVGYSDLNMNIRLPNVTIAEIQLNTTANMVAKERYGHSLYEVYRSIESNPKYAELKKSMSKAQEKLYGISNNLSRDGGFPEDITNIFKAEYKPFVEVIRKDLRATLPSIELSYHAGDIKEET